MAISGAEPRARIARAIWAYSLLTQEDLAKKAGMHKDRLRLILGRTSPAKPHLDELVALAEAARIPERFALEGFEAIPDPGDRIAAIESQLRALSERLPPPKGEIGRYGEDDPTIPPDPPRSSSPEEEDTPEGDAE